MIRQLRGGDWRVSMLEKIVVATIFVIWALGGASEGFVFPSNIGWGFKESELVHAKDPETQLYAGSKQQSLKTEASRNQPNPEKDKEILIDSRPKLVIRYGQAKYKVKAHGALAGIESREVISNNGKRKKTVTKVTEENTDTFMSAIKEVVENKNSIWFERGTYQGGTAREVKTINVYDEKKSLIAIFKQATGEFITFCKLNRQEEADLLKTGNFGGEDSSQAKNAPPKVKPKQNVTNETTPIDSSESDVMGITPDPSSLD